MKRILILLILMSNSLWMLAQQNVSGTVLDENDSPLPGASVIIKGTTTGLTTDMDGKFTLPVKNGDVLFVSFIGYNSQELEYTGQTDLQFRLELNVIGLEEVVTIGYGVQKKVSITNAVSNIDSEELSERNSTNMNQALQGKLPGLTVIDRGGEPGAESLSLRIRGVTSLNSNEPLVLIDGVPGSLSRVNPVDIESVSILKDAASAAIYGSRAAAGVILVTTKTPEKGKLSVTYNGYFGIARTNNDPEHMDAVTYMELQNAAYQNSFGFKYYDDDYIQQWPQNHKNDPDNYPKPNTWHDALYDSAPQHSHTLTVSGGSETVNTRLSFRYMDEEGVLPNFGFEISELRANTNFKLSEKLNFNSNINIRNTERKTPYNPWGLGSWNPVIYRTMQNSQWGTPVYQDGSYGLSVDSYSPLVLAEESGTSSFENTSVIGIFKAEYQLLKELKFSAQYSTQRHFSNTVLFGNKYSFQDKLHPERSIFNNLNSMTDTRTKAQEDGIDAQFTYNNTFGKHTLSGIAGYSEINYEGDDLQGYRQNFYNNDLQSLSLGIDDATQKATGGNSEWGLRSFFSRVNYEYDGRYLFEANARYDGSSRFSDGNRYGFFPSFSVGWRMSNEKFWEGLKNTVNELKLRASWGEVGSQTVGLYTYIETYNQSNYIFNEGLATGYRQTSLASQDLSWETTRQLNIGLDAYLFDNRITFSADYYQKRTEDILLAVPIPSLIGLEATDQNAGVVENKGIELVVSGRQTVGDFKLGLSFNANYNKNEVIDLAGTGPHISAFGNSDYRTITTEGEPINSFYGFETDGFFQTQEEVDNYAKWDGSVGIGDVKYVDQNNDGALTPDDFVILGSEMPDWTFSSNMSVAWKGLKLDLFWQGVSGSDKLVTGATLEMGIWGGFTHQEFADYWTPTNTGAEYPRPTKYTMKNVQISDRTMVDGSYLRLKNIRLSYDIPQKLCGKVKLSGINVYVSATNLLTFSELNKYDIDPEQIGRGPESSFPQTSVSTIGVNINF